MRVWPAIDLKDGHCVRLFKGDMEAVTIYDDVPAERARTFRDAGFDALHVVDLDGAMAGDSRNGEAVGAILKATDVAVQVGGGIRTREQIEAWLDRGAARVVLGTAAVNDPDMVERAAADYPDAIVVALDSRQGEVVTEGWRTGSGVQVNALAERFDKAGVAGILCTDVERDGVMAGPDLEGISALIAAVSAPVLASGGVATLDDLMRLQSAGAAGAVVGRAFYENRLDVREVAAHFANAHRPG